jgi:hypothetical protein
MAQITKIPTTKEVEDLKAIKTKIITKGTIVKK